MKRMNFFLTEKQIAELERRSQETGAPMAELIRRAIDAYLSRESGGVPEKKKDLAA